jgi:tetraacyldisaccharide 4'-kinase
MPSRVSTLLLPLSFLWRAGHAVNLARATHARKTLATPVISIGALTMGGAGKSPMVAHLAARLRELGKNPAILTRGYKRVSREPMVIVPRGSKAPVEETGDEAQMFVRRGDAHVGIGVDRYDVGRKMEEQLAPDIFLLDDGFQHVELARSRDIVMIDAEAIASDRVFPAGRLRESISALSRATEIVVTRGSLSQNYAAPVFTSRVVPLEWIDAKTGESVPLNLPKETRAAAFCGLGNPKSFWRTLDQIGVRPMSQREFRDHHRFTAAELKDIAGSHDVLLTTEKDVMNFPPMLPPVRIYWLKIAVEIAREQELLDRILAARVSA